MAKEEGSQAPYTFQAVRWTSPNRPGEPIPESDCTRPDPHEKSLVWVHITAKDRNATAKMLAERFRFHELEIEDALTEGERPHLHDIGDHLFLTFPAVCFQEPRIYFVEVGIFIASGLMVTVVGKPVDSVEGTLHRLAEKGANVNHIAFLMHRLIDAIVDAYYPALDMLEDQADALENEVFKGKPVQIKDLLRLKRRLLEVRRRLSPMRDILNDLLRRDVQLIPTTAVPYIQDVYDHTLRLLESVDLNRDIMASVLEAHLANVSNRLNEVMRVLTVIATILMSLGLVVGWYGMNFRHMPELDVPWAYPAVAAFCILVVAFEVWLFRKNKWL